MMLALAPMLLIALARVAALLKPGLAFPILSSCLSLMMLVLAIIPFVVGFQEPTNVSPWGAVAGNWGLWVMTVIAVMVAWLAVMHTSRRRSGF